MAKLIVRGPKPARHRSGFQPGHLVAVIPDTSNFGAEEIGNPQLFRCIDLPGVDLADFDDMLQEVAERPGYLAKRRRYRIKPQYMNAQPPAHAAAFDMFEIDPDELDDSVIV